MNKHLPSLGARLRCHLVGTLQRLRTRHGCTRPMHDVTPAAAGTAGVPVQKHWDADRALAFRVFDWNGFSDAPTPAEAELLDGLHAALADTMRRENVMPRLPSVLPMLLGSLRNTGSDARSLAAQIARDPLLVAEVVRVAASPVYGGGSASRTLEDVVQRLGHDGLRRVIASVAMRPIFQTAQPGLTRSGGGLLWAHAERAGIIATHLGQGREDGFAGYLATLSIDIGWISLLRMLDGMRAELPRQPARSTAAALCDAAGMLSRHVSRQWNFPDPVRGAITAAHSGHGDTPELDALAQRIRTARSAATLHLLSAHPEACLEAPSRENDPLQALLDRAFGSDALAA